MKKVLTKIVAIILVATFAIGCAPMASAEWSNYDNDELIGLYGTYNVNPNEVFNLTEEQCLKGAVYFATYSSDESVLKIVDSSNRKVKTMDEGVAIAFIDEYDKNHDYIGTQKFIVVSSETKSKETISKSYINDNTVTYKSTAEMCIPFAYDKKGDAVSSYYVIYLMLDGDVNVDYYGNIDTSNVGSSKVACISISTDGSYSIAISTVTVRYSFFQQLIRIFLLGFLWY